jgi:hypothetical protein
MSEEVWRPLGVDTEEQVAEYDALHEGLPDWMSASFWAWIAAALTKTRSYANTSRRAPMLDIDLTEGMCQILKIPLPNLRTTNVSIDAGRKQIQAAIQTLRKHNTPFQIADYLLAYGHNASPDSLNTILERSKSAYSIGIRAGLPGLSRRVPFGVQLAADSVMARAGRAGARLAKAWEELYGLTPNASGAYRLAILAVEDAAVPVVSPNNSKASLGTVISQIGDQVDWGLPMEREHDKAPSREVLIGMLRMLWHGQHGQHDRHGGQPSVPGNVSMDEAKIAVSIAVTLVHWFDAELIQRAPQTP